ncbi:hypothetical protein MJO28_001190 [Puccinia striiformis f. sp. tritici]|uniref:BolA protein n=4 Tax=Puccinia striiformis TaxID=27350 RepID=A0A0L0UVT2_9BASI|nr:hypothetical protein Pst134EA_000048 [Puccinia striiformis f. sp. tritici]KAI9601689.1 hypothetical protein H4Q26_001522 [Puccinia striiformis f. sp. tritici PST-130]KNE91130.1 hypothetical protein PSTG_15444 [Puccinia striiformis f. sp. tritici PST-78]POW08182.1 hypothetical protein PSHT_09671 [Puccinia striiformis]KAH9466169.1 hypothetical protein Pst134EB_001233 [Puccinia striiformis f. sp. tritici]KAH9472964.1 hypothetical protein Pst134EA_000048 [Puccinia striiformis f. sp. tritici]
MPVSQESLKQKLIEYFPLAIQRKVTDISGGCGQSYEVLIVSPEFIGKTTLAKHRLVNERLKDEISELHAFSQKTFTPEQYALVVEKEQ